LLRQQGFVSGYQSVDVVPCVPYEFTKNAMYEGRLSIPQHARCKKEILMLERDLKTGKIDHPPGGGKDCSDALAGVVYGLTMRREIWGYYKVPPVMIPSNISTAKDALEEKNERLALDMRKVEELSEMDRVLLRKRNNGVYR
jgi:hypothetical protein